MGCLRTIGCLTILVIGVVAGWMTRAMWIDALRPSGRHVVHGDVSGASGVNSPWQPVSDRRAAAARHAVERLSVPRGPVYETVDGAEFASYLIAGDGGHIPGSADSVQAAVIDDRLHVRGPVDLRQVADAETLGPLARFLDAPRPVELVGTVDVPRPGEAVFHVTEVKIQSFALPPVLIPRLLGAMGGRTTVDIPQTVADIRVARGHITLYKNVP